MTLEYQLYLQGSDGKNYLITYEGLKKKLGIDVLVERASHIPNIFYRLQKCEARLDFFEQVFDKELNSWIETKLLWFLGRRGKRTKFRKFALCYEFNKSRGFEHPVTERVFGIFDKAVSDGAIKDCGSGWFESQIRIEET